jgi:uncharacterized protein DUF4157
MPEHDQQNGERTSAFRRRTAETVPTSEHGPAPHPLLRLQSQVGNAQIARMLAQRAAPEEEEQVQAKHDLAQRAAPEEEEQVQASHEVVGVEGGPVGPDTASRIDSMRGSGAALEEGTRTAMEGALGTSFDDVRVHAGNESDTLNRRLTSRAFTTGSDIFLRGDASPSDQRLMAHELTHVVQQRSMTSGGGMHVGAADDAHEGHADSVAEAVTASPVQAQHAAVAQRAGAEEEELQAQHDVQREEPEEEE